MKEHDAQGEAAPDDIEEVAAAPAAVVNERLADCARLFNSGAYHAAHEVLDRLWLSTHGADSDFFKGLIQACIAMHHLQRGNHDGARKLYTSHRLYLAPYLPRHHGLDLAKFLGEMQNGLAPGRSRPAG